MQQLRSAFEVLGVAVAAGLTFWAAERHDLATQAADDARMGVLARLDDFRRLSRFTTWACKFALLEASTKARRMAWRTASCPGRRRTGWPWPTRTAG